VKVVGFRVSEEEEKVVERLKKALIRKFGKLHGVFSQAMVEAIKLYLAHEDFPHAHTKPTRTSKFVRRMVRMYYDLPNGDPFSHDYLDKVIMKHAGGDPRTLRKYRMQLDAWDLIRPQGGSWIRGPERDWLREVAETNV